MTVGSALALAAVFVLATDPADTSEAIEPS
jgi:hypothetical protein